jgi:uncharacterized repeat protein (TIGR01451 family)
LNSQNLETLEEDLIQVKVLEIDDSMQSSSDDANEVFIGNDESDSNEDISSEDEILSTGKKAKLGDSGATQLELDNDADKENIKVGDFVTWVIEAKNKGPNVAKNVKVSDQLPDGLKFVKYSATKGDFDSSTGVWDIGDLEVGEEQVLKIVTKALTTGEKVNKANLTSDTESTTPDRCYEEEEIDVYKDSQYKKVQAKKVSSLMYPTGNPIAVLLVSVLVLLTTSFKRRY